MAIRRKTGGRQAGTPNGITKEVREMLKGIVSNELQRLPEALERMDDKDRAHIVAKLLPYIIPKAECDCPEDSHTIISVIYEDGEKRERNLANRWH